MRRESLLKIKAAVSFICMLALAEHGPDYVITFWQIVMFFSIVAVLGMSIVDSVYELLVLKEKECSGLASDEALN